MATLLDSTVLVAAFDARDPARQVLAAGLVEMGLRDGEMVLPHQVIVEFFAATTRPLAEGVGGEPLLSREEATREVEELMQLFEVVFPNELILRTALRGAGAYGLSWHQAHLWAYAEVLGLSVILSEDFEHGRHYGRVRVLDPFRMPETVNEPALEDRLRSGLGRPRRG